MNQSDAVTAISTLISLAGIWVLVMWLGRDYHAERCRQSLFKLRAELFELAADGKIAFDHPAYTQLRSTFNGLIRVAHRLSLFNVGLFYLFNRGKFPLRMKPYFKKWEENTRGLNPEVKKILNEQLQEFNIISIKHLVFNSPMMMITVVPAVITWISFKLFMGKILDLLTGPIDSFDNAAEAIADMAA